MGYMSGYESKTVLRAEIPLLRGANKNDVYLFLKNILGEPPEIDVEDDGTVNFFRYEANPGEFQEAFELSYRGSGNQKVGVEYVFGHKKEEDMDERISLNVINEIAEKMTKLFQIDPDTLCIFSYSWYNGSDEPVEFN